MATWFPGDKSSRSSTRFLASLISPLFFSLVVSYAYLPPEFLIQQQGFTTINDPAVFPASDCRLPTTHQKTDSSIGSECLKNITESSQIRCALTLLDADFFNDTQVLEITKGAEELNIPIIRANRKLVASVNGGLYNPSPLVFNPEWSKEQSQGKASRFNHPLASGIQRPNNEEDIAFMSVLELGELIKSRQITSEELTGIFLKRLRSRQKKLTNCSLKECISVHSVDMLLIVQSFWIPSEGKIQMMLLRETFSLGTHSLLISQSLQLVILTMQTWRLFMCLNQKVLRWLLSN